MNNRIKCPSCGNLIEVTELLKKQVEEELKGDYENKYRKEIELVRKTAEEKTVREMDEKNRLEINDLKKTLEEKEKKLEDALKLELDLRKKRNELEEEKRVFELKIQRQLDEEREKIKEKILAQIAEEQKMRDREKDKIIDDLKTALNDAQRKANQSSQQLQGEVQELDLEEMLKDQFPTDEIEPVGKGVRGADVRQIVKTSRGNVCGVILWESKRTKQWSDEWIVKLKDDLRAEKANIPIIVSTVLPKEAVDGMGYKEGVWICSYPLLLPLADLIRQRLTDVARERYISQNKGTKADLIYEYITGHEFRQQIEALAEVYQEMHGQVNRERVAFEKIWRTREAQIHKLFANTSGILGSLKGYIGSSLPQIKGLDLPELEGGDNAG